MNVQEAIDSHEKSLKELVSFYEKSQDEHNKKFLDSEIKLLTSKIDQFKRNLESGKKPIACRILDDYSWGQRDSLIKIYLNRSDIVSKEIDKSKCEVEFLDGNHTVVIKVGSAKLTIKKLLYPVDRFEGDFVNLTKSFVIVNLKKKVNQKWDSLQKSNVPKTPAADTWKDDDEEPGQNMMNLMKKMYSEGVDEMKKMINKAWSESQAKKSHI